MDATTHLHTGYSFDACLFMNRSVGLKMAYRYMGGLPLIYSFLKITVFRLIAALR
ncbi:MAG: DUF3604 domain-containing protein [Parahaliea sp.]